MSVCKGVFMILLIGGLVGIFGCQSEPEPAVEEKPVLETTSPAETTSRLDTSPDNKTNFQETMRNQYGKLDQDIQTLQSKAEDVPAESKEQFNQMIDSLQMRREVAKERLDALGTSTNEGWENLKDSAEEALNDLQKTYDQVAAQFL